MGVVFTAKATRLDRTVAIKVLPEHVASDPDLKQRFEREAKTISSLNYPYICTLHDIGSQNGLDFLVMEYLDGETQGHVLCLDHNRAYRDTISTPPRRTRCRRAQT